MRLVRFCGAGSDRILLPELHMFSDMTVRVQPWLTFTHTCAHHEGTLADL